jgi:hypothetical protein
LVALREFLKRRDQDEQVVTPTPSAALYSSVDGSRPSTTLSHSKSKARKEEGKLETAYRTIEHLEKKVRMLTEENNQLRRRLEDKDKDKDKENTRPKKTSPSPTRHPEYSSVQPTSSVNTLNTINAVVNNPKLNPNRSYNQSCF